MAKQTQDVLFYRGLIDFNGGVLKVWHYFNHVKQCPNHRAFICFTKESVWDERNPWRHMKREALVFPDSVRHDVRFLAGTDWLMIDEAQRSASPVPILNLIQGVRHAQPYDPRYPFLKHRAIRICVSEEVATAIAETGQVNGPVFVIPNGIDWEGLPPPVAGADKEYDVFIAALKLPELGAQLFEQLKAPGLRIDLQTGYIPRPEFVKRLSRARVAVCLPNPAEGSCLPALEAMAMGALVVCPDCIGNRSFCLPGKNCFRPDHTMEDILEAVNTARRMTPAQTLQMLANARQTAAEHDLMHEREAFFRILESVDDLW